MKIYDYIDGALYINLNYRVDRKERVEQRCAELQIPVERFDAIQLSLATIDNPYNDPAWHKKMGCTESHFACIRLAQSRGWKNVWIMEDDVKFSPSFAEQAPRIINELRSLEWDMFFFGGEPNRKVIPHSDLLVKTNGVYGAHSYLVNHTFYDKILSTPTTNRLLDIIYLNYNEHDKVFYLSKDLLCLQDGDFESDLWGGKVNRDDLYDNAYNLYVRGV
jgi:hypothetical protein